MAVPPEHPALKGRHRQTRCATRMTGTTATLTGLDGNQDTMPAHQAAWTAAGTQAETSDLEESRATTMRSIAFLIVLILLVLLGPLYAMYGQVDPCRALAKDLAMRAEKAGGLVNTVDQVFGDPEIQARRDTAEKSTWQCAAELVNNLTLGPSGT